MGRKLLAWMLVTLLTVMVLPVQAMEGKLIRVGYIDYDGFIASDAERGFAGYGAEYLQEVAKYTGWQYIYSQDTWENCLEKLHSGELDLLCTAQYTEERARLFDYAKYPLGVEYGILYVAPENNKVYYNDYAAFEGMRVGLLKDSFQTEAFREYARQHNFSFVPVEYLTDAEMTAALRAGKVDAIAAGSLARKTDVKPVAKFSIDDFYFITCKNTPEILEPLNEALEEIKMTDPYLDARLYEKYYGDSVIASKPMLTRQEADFIKANPVLRVACKPDWPPYEYAGEDGRCKGLSVEMLDNIADISGMSFEYIPMKVDQALEEGKADLIASVTDLDGCMAYTSPYISVPIQVIGTPEALKGGGRTLALEQGARFMESVLRDRFGIHEVQFYENLNICLDVVARGQADITVAGDYAVNRLIQDERYQNLMVMQIAQDSIPLCIGLSRDLAPEARAILEKSIAFLTEESRERALQRVSLSYAMAPTLSDFWTRYSSQLMLAAIAFILVAGGGAVAVYWWQRRRFEFEATHDALTGCLTITPFKKEAAALLHRYGINDYYILKFDILHLKYINQKYGTKMGDALLKALVQHVGGNLSPRELLGRVMDDHFVALLTGESFARMNQEVVYEMDKIKRSLKIDAPVILKCGVYKIHDPGETVSGMIDKASVAQKSIKQSPKRNIMVYNDTLYQQLLTESQIESEMAPALANGDFQVYFQPQIDLTTMRAVAAEALIRWIRTDGSTVGPDIFIPLFERNGFVEQLDFYVLDQVCGWIRSRIDNGLEAVPISVNQSRFLLSNPDYVRDVERILRRYEIPKDMLTLELTESMCLENGEVLLATMERLHELNVQVSIDDFGSGYSSLNLLSEMAADELKIDRGFLSGSTGSIPKRQVIAKVVELAQMLKIRVVCEGVETREQEQFLKSVGCDLAQGFLYARPMTLGSFETLLASCKNFSTAEDSPKTEMLPAHPNA